MRKITATAVAVLVGIVVLPAPARAEPRAKIDTYNYDGYGTRPCARDRYKDRVTYTCRGIGYGPYISERDNQTSSTFLSEKHGSVIIQKDGTMYEGCDPSRDGSKDVCASQALDPRTKNYRTKGGYIWMAVKKWAYNQSVATLCVYAMFHASDSSDIVHNCT